MVRGRFAAGLAGALLAGLLLSACVAPRPPREGHNGEWISISGSSVDRRGSDSDSVSDSAAFSLEGGYNVLDTKNFDAGFEIGALWSRHKVPQTDGTNSDPRMNSTRYNLGARAALDFAPLNAVLWVDGGIYVRNESSNDEPSYEQNGRGNYIGAGLEFWYDQTGRIGPFVRSYDFADSDLTEIIVGLCATFAL